METGGGGSRAGGEFLSMSRFAAMSFHEARSSMHPTVREPPQTMLSMGASRAGGGAGRTAMPFGGASIPDVMLLPEHMSTPGLAFRPLDALSRGQRVRTQLASTRRPGTGGMDEYQALQLLDENVVKRGVSERKLRSLPEQPVPRRCVGKEKCDVCQMEYESRDQTITLPCRHLFHAACIKQWFKENRTCPVCRYEVEA